MHCQLIRFMSLEYERSVFRFRPSIKSESLGMVGLPSDPTTGGGGGRGPAAWYCSRSNPPQLKNSYCHIKMSALAHAQPVYLENDRR
jgi:hypothetical protein